MKKIPTLFEREFKNHKVVKVKTKVTPGCEWVLNGEGVATVKFDGSCCAIMNGKFYKRYDAKKGKPLPDGAIPCQTEPDPVTGHFPCWVECSVDNPADKWFLEALNNTLPQRIVPGTYEAVGPHFQGNPYGLERDILIKHGEAIVDNEVRRTYEGIREWLRTHPCEGLVFWKDGEPQCKIKRSDFGFVWPLVYNNVTAP